MDERNKNEDGVKSDADNKPSELPDKAPKEIGGRRGPDPIRYGDWENNGIASDF